MNVLIIGDGNIDHSAWACEQFPNIQLLNSDNFDTSISLNQNFFTSLRDLNRYQFDQAIRSANRVIFKPFKNSKLLDETQTQLLRSDKFIENFTDTIDTDPLNLLSLADHRQGNDKQIWVSGCSFADGIGVSKQQRYGQLVADKLLLPVSFLTSPGSSIPWAADQILRSDIRANDIIIWGLTAINRYISYKNKIEINVHPQCFTDPVDLFAELEPDRPQVMGSTTNIKKSMALLSEKQKKLLIEDCLSDDRIFQAIKSIFQVINFSEKSGAKLILFMQNSTDKHNIWSMGLSDDVTIQLQYMNQLKNFLHISPMSDTSAIDNAHPGINTHQSWAEEIVNLINKRKYI